MGRHFAMVLTVLVIGLMPLALAMDFSLQHGSVKTYDFGPIILHAYATGDPMEDECFALETATGLIAIESPAFENNLQEWKRYLDGLNKPLTDVLLSYHPTGGRWYGGAVTHATEKAKQAFAEGGTARLVGILKGAFGDGFNDDISAVDKTLRPGANTIGGVEFVVADDGEGYTIAVPAIKAVYLHMLGAKVHSILTSQEHIAAAIATLEQFKSDGYTLFLSSHNLPEMVVDVDEKIAYLRTTATIAARSADRSAFVTGMQTAYPAYAGENYLEMTAGAFFTE